MTPAAPTHGIWDGGLDAALAGTPAKESSGPAKQTASADLLLGNVPSKLVPSSSTRSGERIEGRGSVDQKTRIQKSKDR